jgi:hypothetical protein
MAQNSRPVRMQRAMPAPQATDANRGKIRPRPRVSFCLQAEHREESAPPAVVASGAKTQARTARAPRKLPARRRRRRPWMLVAGGIAGTAAFIVLWVTLILSAPNPQAGASSPSPAAPPAPAASPSQQAPAVAEPAIQTVEWDVVAESV